MERWRGKTAVVTGVGSGMGQAIAVQLARHDVRVVGLDIQFPTPKNSDKIIYRICDISKPESLAETFKLVDEKYGGVDIMVNCAGCIKKGHITNVGDQPVSEEDLMQLYDVNIKGMVLCSRHAVNSMKKRGFDGHVINVNSIAGHYVPFNPRLNVYGSTKHAVTAFTQSLAVELATFQNNKIKTTSLSPGLVKTPLSIPSIPDFSAVPYLEPEDIADAVITVLSTPPHVNITELTVQPVGELRL